MRLAHLQHEQVVLLALGMFIFDLVHENLYNLKVHKKYSPDI